MKSSNLFLAAILLTSSLAVRPDEVTEELAASYRYCDSMAKYAATALEFRLSGKPKEPLLMLAQASPEMIRITELAYAFPLVKSPGESEEQFRESAKSQLSESIRLSCQGDALKKAKAKNANHNPVASKTKNNHSSTAKATEKSSANKPTASTTEAAGSHHTTSGTSEKASVNNTRSGTAEKLPEMDLANNPNKYMIIRRHKDDLDMLLIRKLENAGQAIGIYAFIYATTTGGWELADKHVLRGSWWPDTQQFYWSLGAVGAKTGCTFWGDQQWSGTFHYKKVTFGERTIPVWEQSAQDTAGRERNKERSCRKIEVNLQCTRMIRCHEWHDDSNDNDGFYILDNQSDALYLYNFFRKQIRR